MKRLSEEEKKWLEKILLDGAECVDEYPEHWVNGADDSESYCYECCGKEVERLEKKYPEEDFFIDGGWGIDGDYTPICKDCEKQLINDFTNSACKEEVEHFLDCGFDIECGADCLSVLKIISSAGWEHRTSDKKDFLYNYCLPAVFYEDLHKLCRQILIDVNEHIEMLKCLKEMNQC